MSEMDVCLWIEYLDTTGIAPPTIRNKLSHARVFLRLTGGSLDGFNHLRAARALDAVLRRKDHVPVKKVAIPAHTIRTAIQHIPDDHDGLMVILLMFYGVLRQSEVAPPSVNKFDPLRHLTRADVSIGDTVTVRIKAGKNLQRYDQQKTVTLLPTGDSLTCPVAALHRALEATPGLPPSYPLLVFKDKHTPMPTSHLRAVWGRTLTQIGADPTIYSLHSLRKASATLAHSGGCSDLEMQRHGGWTSNAYQTYIQTDNYKVTNVLSTSLS